MSFMDQRKPFLKSLNRQSSLMIDTQDTLTKFILTDQRMQEPDLLGLSRVIYTIQTAIKIISTNVNAGGNKPLYDKKGSFNCILHSPEVLKKAVDQTFINMLKELKLVYALYSKYYGKLVYLDPENEGKFIVLINALDGIENVKLSLPLGSIFSIYGKKPHTKANEKELLQNGNKILLSGYALYGSNTEMVISLGDGFGVYGFSFDPDLGEFILSYPQIRIPLKGKIISIHEAGEQYWDSTTAAYIQAMKMYRKEVLYQGSFSGCFVADFHRLLLQGGIYIYTPGDKSSEELSLAFDCIPMAHIVREAGGQAATVSELLMEIIPKTALEEISFIVGSKDHVSDFLELATFGAATTSFKPK